MLRECEPVAKTPKQPNSDLLIKNYILNGCKNAKQAAIDAGYSPKTAEQSASRVLRSVKAQQAIEEYQKTSHKAYIWTKVDKLLKLQSLFDMSTEKYIDAQGNERRENLSAAINAIKEHNAMMGDVEDKEEAKPLNIVFSVREAKDDVEVTNART